MLPVQCFDAKQENRIDLAKTLKNGIQEALQR